MKNCKHQFKYIESSRISGTSGKHKIEKYKCIKCDRWYFKNIKTGKRIILNGGIGEEVESNFK